VLPDADPVVIEAAYKALMKRHHPDIRSGGGAAVGERIAAELNQAYQTLRDPDRRAAYDAEEHSRQERHRAELARAFEPPVPRAAPCRRNAREPARAGQRAAAWIGAAGILMLGGAIYLLAQGTRRRSRARRLRAAAKSPAPPRGNRNRRSGTSP
jgi:curved DNA-binding protein CbpA